MTLLNEFRRDNDITLKAIQDYLFESLISDLFCACKNKYLEAIEFVNIETELSKNLRKIFYICDYQGLYRVYEIVATYFRYLHSDKTGQLMIPDTISGCKDLSSEEATKIYYKREWVEFWKKEIKDLSNDREVAVPVLAVVCYKDTEIGKKAMEHLFAFLVEKYNIRIWENSSNTA